MTTPTETPQLEQIKLADIRRDGGTQQRAAIDPDTVAAYAALLADGTTLPPATVVREGDTFWLVDGFHRYAAYGTCGMDAMPCTVLPGTRRDAILQSVGANATHGLRRTNADKRRAVETMLGDPEWVNWSDREIARRCAVSQPYVGHVRASLKLLSVNNDEPATESPATRTYTTKHGTTATMQTGAIGKAPAVDYDPLLNDGCSDGLDGEIDAGESTPAVAPAKPLAPDEKPWDAYIVKVEEIQSDLRAVADKMRDVFQYDTATKQLREPWAHFLSHAGTIGNVNQIVRMLRDELPAAIEPSGKGFLTVRQQEMRRGLAANRAA
ncbi:MAG TPA: ParB/RepB/Spo0J family partition protein [Tepidisphaeraceae bacterium]|nr:ParB/RepB/Spo0J family partition protein [Tepidisphaeraceae bacterium]